jgi:hypothetical protein
VLGFSNFMDCLLGSGALLLGGFLYQDVLPAIPFILQLVVMTLTVGATFLYVTEPKKQGRLKEV